MILPRSLLLPYSQLYPLRDSTDRGQVGIGTLVLLIAALLVATTTVGVFMQTTGMLQSQTAEVSDNVDRQLSQRVSSIAMTGSVETTDGTPSVTEVKLILKANSAALPVELGSSVVSLQTPTSTASLVYSGSTVSDQGVTFGVEPLRDSQDSVPTLTEPADRFAIVIATPSLSPNARIQIKLILPTGTTQRFTATVPPSLDGETTVELE